MEEFTSIVKGGHNMGSFNVACVVTNMSIKERDEVVAIKVAPMKRSCIDIIKSTHYMLDFPMYGKYADYGKIDIDYQYDDDLMFLHKFAYDAVVASVKRAKKRTNDYYAKNGVPEYVQNKLNKTERVLQYMEGHLDIPKKLEGCSSLEDYSEWLVYDQEMQHKNLMFFSSEGEYDHTVHWVKLFEQSDNPRAFLKRYKEEVGIIYFGTYHLNYRIEPSRYAGQEVDNQAYCELNKGIKEYLQNESK